MTPAVGKLFDAVIVGGGPAGLAAAIYLGRYLRPTLVLNEKEPRTPWHRPTAHNVLGFPAGIMRSQLLEWGRAHAGQYASVVFQEATVERLARTGEGFMATDAGGGVYRGRGLVLATGVEYQLPAWEGVYQYAGLSVFHCPECDGYKVRGRRVVVLGTGAGSANMALGLRAWDAEVTLCTDGREPELDAAARGKLAAEHIGIFQEKTTGLTGDVERGQIAAVRLEDGRELACEAVFVNMPCDPPLELYAQLGVDLHKGRWVKVDYRQRTTVPRCYAAGDIVAFAQTQLSVAMGQGATAAIWLHKELLPEGRKIEE